MIKRILIVLTAVALLAALSLVVYADNNGNEQVNWTIAGPIFSDIQNIDPEDGGSYTLLNLTAKGSPGKADLMAVGTGDVVALDDQCPGANLQVKFKNGGFVATFEDQSMLFFVVDESEGARNALCIHFGAPNEGAFEYNVVGGTGRFEGANGSVLVETISWGINSVLSAEEGTITGVIELP